MPFEEPNQPDQWPRIRNLPLRERTPFKKWLRGQTCPCIDGEAEQAQDGYYPWDYDRWKHGLRVID